MSHIAFLGLGAMGSRMAARLLQAGHTLAVWNRTPAATQPLVAAGARAAETPALATAGAEVVISMVRDDEASAAVWCDAQTGALAGMQPGAIAIESSTVSLDWIRELDGRVQARGLALIEAPVSGSRPAAEAGQLVYLIGGDEAVLRRVQRLLGAMGSAIHHVGGIGAGTLTKLATNSLLGVHVTALAEIIGLLRQHGADVQAALRAISGTSVWAPVDGYLSGSMLAGDFRPQFPVALIEKDFGYTVAAAGSSVAVPTLAVARAVFRQGIDRALGDENMTSVVKLYEPSTIR